MTIEEIMAGESKNVEFKVQRPKDSFKYVKEKEVGLYLEWMINRERW